MIDFSEIDPPVMPFRLRNYQAQWVRDIEAMRAKGFSRLLVDAPGGCGKSTLFAALAFNEWTQRQGRTLVLENRDKLVRQTAERLANETGLEVDIEMAGERASPYAPIVVASVPTMGRVNRLTSFASGHFSQIVPDECHLSLAPLWQRVMRFHHYGPESLNEDWRPPEDGTYEPKCFIAGTTATPDLGKKKNLGSFFQQFAVRYSYAQAVDDGWLVGPIAKRKPLPHGDLRRIRVGNGPNGRDLNAQDLSERLIPIVAELADQIVEFASDRKTIAFTPSVECARLLSLACIARGLKSVFVSGDCIDRDEKTAEFEAMGRGSVLTNCSLYNAGWDHPPIDCVAWFRPTISRAFMLQGLYRGTRVLPGLVSDDMTADERRAAIAASPKRDLLIIDPLWKTEDIPLCSFFDLYTDKPEVKEKLEALPEGADLAKAAEKGERDWQEALRKAAAKKARREAETVDPLKWSLSLGEDRIAHYRPETDRDAGPLNPGQIAYLQKNKIDANRITCYGQAEQIISTHLERWRMGLATPTQLDFLARIGLDPKKFSHMPEHQVRGVIGSRMRQFRARRATA